MSEDMDRPPWWLSDSNDDSTPGDTSAGGDTWSLLGVIGGLAGEWWTASGASEHADHKDPVDHPDCLVCKALVGLQAISQPTAEPTQLPRVCWLPVRRA